MTDAEKLREQLRDAIMEEHTDYMEGHSHYRSCYIHPDQAQEEADLAITVIVKELGITEECSCYQKYEICRSCQKNIRAVRTLLEASTNE
tara:strand:- start:981 stop:1250 length:270 start_codon:yes stop_codon:yes gene_type:complete